MNDNAYYILAVVGMATFKMRCKIGLSEVLIPLFRQTMQPEREEETLKMLLILAPALRKLLPEPPCPR